MKADIRKSIGIWCQINRLQNPTPEQQLLNHSLATATDLVIGLSNLTELMTMGFWWEIRNHYTVGKKDLDLRQLLIFKYKTYYVVCMIFIPVYVLYMNVQISVIRLSVSLWTASPFCWHLGNRGDPTLLEKIRMPEPATCHNTAALIVHCSAIHKAMKDTGSWVGSRWREGWSSQV